MTIRLLAAAEFDADPRVLRQRVLGLVALQLLLALFAAGVAWIAWAAGTPFTSPTDRAALGFAGACGWIVMHAVAIAGLWRGRGWSRFAAAAASAPYALYFAFDVVANSREAGWPWRLIAFVLLAALVYGYLSAETRQILAAQAAHRAGVRTVTGLKIDLSAAD